MIEPSSLQTMKMTRKSIAILVALSCAVSVAAQAKVFQRWDATAQSTIAMKAAGGAVAYEADITLNGGKGHLTVFGFNEPVTPLIARLERMFGGEFIHAGGDLAYATIVSDQAVVKVTMFRLNEHGTTMVFHLEQSRDAAAVSTRRPSRHLLKALPAYPGSTPLFCATDNNTRMSLAVSTAPADADDVQRFYESSLASSGWKPLLPASTAPGNRLEMYQKGADLCGVTALPADAPGHVWITLLHKRPRLP